MANRKFKDATAFRASLEERLKNISRKNWKNILKDYKKGPDRNVFNYLEVYIFLSNSVSSVTFKG
jgi:hypothetical protein